MHETILLFGGMKMEVAAGFMRITAGINGGLFGKILYFWVHKKGSTVLS
jgi:hypothetical protein